MRLRDKQYLMAELLPRLLDAARFLGFKPRLGDAYRHPDCRVGHLKSLHRDRLAFDLILDDSEGNWIKTTEPYTRLGVYWEDLDSLCAWGGRFRRPDGNHFSIRHRGMR